MDNRIARAAAKAALDEYKTLRNQPQKGPEESQDKTEDGKGKSSENSEEDKETPPAMEMEVGKNVDEVKTEIQESEDHKPFDREKSVENEDELFDMNKPESLMEGQDMPTSSKGEDDTTKPLEEKPATDAETLQVLE